MTVHSPRSGFTILEILLVLAILVIIMAVAYPTMEGMYADARVQAAADDVRGAWAEARVRSIDNGVPYRFAVKPNAERYRVAPDLAEFWDGAHDSEADGESEDGKTVLGSLPKDILFKLDGDAPDSGGGWRTVATFLPDGTCKEDARVVLRADGCQPLVISVRSLTGITRVQPQKQFEEQNR
jgi:prepilin-type N-terminal cleavage/methylation domain-containing protein